MEEANEDVSWPDTTRETGEKGSVYPGSRVSPWPLLTVASKAVCANFLGSAPHVV